jgi:hypothetical protein
MATRSGSIHHHMIVSTVPLARLAQLSSISEWQNGQWTKRRHGPNVTYHLIMLGRPQNARARPTQSLRPGRSALLVVPYRVVELSSNPDEKSASASYTLPTQSYAVCLWEALWSGPRPRSFFFCARSAVAVPRTTRGATRHPAVLLMMTGQFSNGLGDQGSVAGRSTTQHDSYRRINSEAVLARLISI